MNSCISSHELYNTVEIKEIIKDKTLKAKDKTALISQFLNENPHQINPLVNEAKLLKGSDKATYIEAIEHATLANPMLCTPDCFNFAIFSLTDKAPRVKWESARVIANTAHLFPDELTGAIVNLLANTEHKGTVVRWSAAQALSKIVSLNTTHNSQLVPALKTVSAMEEKPSIQKIYTTALKRF